MEMAAPAISQARGRAGWPSAATYRCASAIRGRAGSTPGRPASVARRLVDLGCTTISLGDTIGVATAGQVAAVLWMRSSGAGVARDRLALHFHDTYGQALANVLAGLEAGVTEFDASAGGLGGCPFARSATGNLATEDLVWLLEGLGIPTGVDLGALVETSRWMAGRARPTLAVAGGAALAG